MSQLKYFSMFSGIGGFEIGIHNAYGGTIRGVKAPAQGTSEETRQGLLSSEGQDPCTTAGRTGERPANTTDERPLCVGYSEIDKYAIKVYERNFNGHTNYGDATKINAAKLPDFDLLVGGFPCQAFSIAGKRSGFDDTRGTLFFDIARILAEKRPRHLVLENVKGLLNHKEGKTFQTILTVLADMGYRVEWQLLNSKGFGVPQNRERVYIVGHHRGECAGQILPIFGDRIETDSILDGEKTISPTITSTYSKNQSDAPYVQESRIKVNAMLNSETWQKRNESIRRVYDTDGLAPTIPTGTGGGVMPKIEVPQTVAMRGRYDDNGEIEQQLEPRSDGMTNTLTSVPKDNMVMVREATQKGYATAEVGDGINLAAIGSKTRRGRVTKGASSTLHSLGLNGTFDGTRIRRFTPRETERLQAFPDDWTLHGIDGEISDSQRYKMNGNAVTTTVVQAIMERFKVHDERRTTTSA